MKICDTCGELKPCMKESTNLSSVTYGVHVLDFDWVCKECIKAKGIIYELEKERKRKESEELDKGNR